jgi:hypothetical protein
VACYSCVPLPGNDLQADGRVWYPAFWASTGGARAIHGRDVRAVRSTPGDVLAEDSWLLLKSGKVVLYDDPATMAVLANAGAWDQSVLLQDLQRRKFSYVITESDLSAAKHSNNWSAQALAAIQLTTTYPPEDPRRGSSASRDTCLTSLRRRPLQHRGRPNNRRI